MSYVSEVTADTPLAWWRQGEASGTTMGDSSGNSHPGTYTNVPTQGVAGLVGDADTANNYNGTDDLATITTGVWMDVTSITLEAWCSPDVVPSSTEFNIMGRDTGTFVGSNKRGWHLRLSTAGKALFIFWASDGGAQQTLTGTTTVTAGGVYHVVGTYDGTTAKLYVNGAEEATLSISGAINTGQVGDILIAAAPPSNSARFDGTIDEVAIYSTALSSTRVAAHYDATQSSSATVDAPTATATAQGAVPTVGSDAVAIDAPTASATAAASVPTVGGLSPTVVEIAFDSGYSTPAASRTWTDVTQYVRAIDGINITHGRGDERSQADANTLQLTLINSDGRFTPGLASSPYYPNVKIGRPIRVTVTTAAGYASVRYVGYIDEWPVEWPAVVTTFATSTITASSRIARLGASAPLGNHIYEEIKRDSPAAHYMLDNLADSVSGGVPLAQVGTGTAVTFEGTGPTDGIQAAQFAGGKYLKASGAIASSSTPISLAAAFNASASAADSVILAIANSSGTDRICIELNSSGQIVARGVYAAAGFGGATWGMTSPLSYEDGETHVVEVVRNHAVGPTFGWLYVDGVEVATSTTGTFAGSFTDVFIGHYPLSPPEVGAPAYAPLTGVVAHAAVFDTALSASRTAAHAEAALDGSAGETAEARLQRYAAFAGIPTAEQSISTAADTPMAYIDTTGQTALSLMQTVATTDGGVLYDSRDGLLAYTARSARYTAAAAVTLDANAGQVGASYAPKLDRSSIINEVVATVADGSDPQETIRAVDQDSYDDYGPHRDDIELATTDADEAHAAAWWRVNTYSEPQARAPQLEVEIAHLSTALQASVLALNVGDKIAVTNLPSQSDAASKSFFVEGYNERMESDGTHTFAFNVSPTTGFDVWTVEDATYGQYDAYPIAY